MGTAKSLANRHPANRFATDHQPTTPQSWLTNTTPSRLPRSRREEHSASSLTVEPTSTTFWTSAPTSSVMSSTPVPRRINRGLKRRPMGLIKKLRKAKQEAKPNEKPDPVKTHLRDMIVVPEMIGSVIAIYSGKEFNQVEIKPEMVGHYLAEFSISYKPVKHGRPGIGATNSSRFIPLK